MNTSHPHPLAARIEIFRQRLVAVAEQMGESLARTAFSTNIKERRDHSCALFDARGELLAQAAHIPVHLGSMPAGIDAVRAAFPSLSPGDAVLLNDPYTGGSHLPDITLVSPILLADRLIGFAANRAHHADVGGRAPGSMGLASHIDDEGVRFGPTKWFDAGREIPDLRDRLLAAVRNPAERLGDLRAQLAANEIGFRGLGELLHRTGRAEFDELSSALRAYAERLMRKTIAEIPSGRYAALDQLDGDGISDRPVRLALELTVAADSIRVAFDGTDPQVAGPVNCPLAVTRSAVYYAFICLAGPRLPLNAGMFAPIDVVAPRGCVVNAVHPAAVAAGNVETSQRIVDLVFQTLARAIPDRIPAGSAGTMASVSLAGIDPRTGRAFSYYETIGGGAGASAHAPGQSAVHTHMTNTLNTPVEALESACPIRVTRYAVRRKSGGAGRHPGGDGIVREIEALAPLDVSILADRAVHGGRGLAGGAVGLPFSATAIRSDGRRELWPCKTLQSLAPGDRLLIQTPGGGGWGS